MEYGRFMRSHKTKYVRLCVVLYTVDDQEIFISPGLLYVKTRWALEATIQIPVHQKLDDRMERDYVFGIGFKVRF